MDKRKKIKEEKIHIDGLREMLIDYKETIIKTVATEIFKDIEPDLRGKHDLDNCTLTIGEFKELKKKWLKEKKS